MNYLKITCRDPIVARDGRPFNEGGKIRILPWVLPSVVAGSFRTLLGKKIDPSFKGELPAQLKQVSVHGFFPHYENQIYLPKPEDCIAKPTDSDSSELLAVTPQKLEPNQGCDLPAGNLLPVMLSGKQSQDDFKPASLPEWWPLSAIEKWLTNQPVTLNESFLKKPEVDQRTHLTVNEDLGTAEDGLIFNTASLSLESLNRYGTKNESVTVSYPLKIKSEKFHNHCTSINEKHPLGGERRLANWETSGDQSKLWSCPPAIASKLKSNPENIRMLLATPAIFKDGWKPEWLIVQANGSFQGTPPGTNIKLKLVGATISRWKAVSGWSLAKPIGPKPTRRMVPAGGVYFFNRIDGDATCLSNNWLQSVSDDDQDKRDGFGLAAWGIW